MYSFFVRLEFETDSMNASITLLRSTCKTCPKLLCKNVSERVPYMQKATVSNTAIPHVHGFTHSLSVSARTQNNAFPTISKAYMSTEPGMIEPGMTVSMATANRQDVLKYEVAQNVQKFRAHATDTGSSSVQVAVMTQKIQNFTKHALMHKKDKASMRGFQMLIQKRRKMLKYLKKNDFEEFKKVVTELKLENEARRISSNKKY